MLDYKCRWKRKRLVVIDRWFPSSKRCHHCGMIHEDLSLSDRMWTCAGCGAMLDRDLNAAQNIRLQGLFNMDAEGHSESLTDCGGTVRPALAAG